MIRDLAIISIIVISVIGSHIFLQNMIKEDSTEITKKMENVKLAIESNVETEELKDEISNIYEEWRKKADIWSILVDHQEVDAIEKSIMSVKASIESKDMEQIIPKIDETIFMISLIEDKERLNLKNIF